MLGRVFKLRSDDRVHDINQRQNDTVVLLTACVDPREVAFVARRDPQIRLEDYKRALRLWLADCEAPSIVFCENSGYDLTEIENTCRQHNIHNKQVELLSFDGQEFPPHLGKGYGEMRIISYALAHSRLISEHHMVMKVTGRFYVRNVGSIVKEVAGKDTDIFCDLRWNLTFADSRIFCASVSFLQQYLTPMQELLDDSRNITFEHVLARAAHQAMARGRRWAMLPHAADIQGVLATANVAIPFSILYRAQRELFRLIKAAILAR